MTQLYLTSEEQALLDGAEGPGVQRAMEIVVTLGRVYGAAELVPIASAHISGVSYKNLGPAGLEFLNRWADEGARARVDAWLNPMGMEAARWREMSIPADFAEPQLAVIAAFRRMGLTPTLSCTPYLLPGHAPQRRQHLAWAESSAVAFANSVLGARTNREGGPSALAAAIVGRTACYGYHLDEGRRATHVVEVTCPLRGVADFGALGQIVGQQVGGGVPTFADLARWLPPLPPDITRGGEAVDRLKTLGASLAAYGAVALFHVAGYTPEAADAGDALLRADAQGIVVDSLEEAYAAMNALDVLDIDLVSIGCPHASLAEIAQVADFVRGQRLQTRLWVTTARHTREQAVAEGWVQIIEAAGGRVVADTCTVVAPLQLLGIRSLATNGAKTACYAPAHSGVRVRFGTLEQCLRAAVTGQWGQASRD
ncbi:MAG: aconitase X catalytic domain-containing protein [Chloroflexi bacterium]|nr:aconitase X catalytic domain-containing protein [Chloroflexota bacterium]